MNSTHQVHSDWMRQAIALAEQAGTAGEVPVGAVIVGAGHELIAQLKEMGIEDPNRVYDAEELASGETVLFAACGITPGTLMEGVRFFAGGARTQSLVISTQSKTVRFVDTIHMFERPRVPKALHLRY